MNFKNRKVIIESDEKKTIKLKVEHKIYLKLLTAAIGLTTASYLNNYPYYKIKEVQLNKESTIYKVVSRNVVDLNKVEEISSDVLNRHLVSNKYDENNAKVFIYNDKVLNMNNQVASVELVEVDEFKYKTTKEQIEIEKEREVEKKKLLENFDLIDINELKKTDKALKISTKLDGKFYQYKVPFNQNSKFQLDLFTKPIDIEKYLPKEEENENN